MREAVAWRERQDEHAKRESLSYPERHGLLLPAADFMFPLF